MWPYRFLTTTIPEHLAREHPVLRVLNRQIAAAIIKEPRDNSFIYALNDGITPLTSALFLPNNVLSSGVIAHHPHVLELKKHVDVGKARVFANIDHLSFIDNYRPFLYSHLLRDELAPEEGKKTVFAWIHDDLMQDNVNMARNSDSTIKAATSTAATDKQLVSD